MRKHVFTVGEYYHIFNRGVDKKDIIKDSQDLERFIQSCTFFNTTESIGSIYELSFKKPSLGGPTTKLSCSGLEQYISEDVKEYEGLSCDPDVILNQFPNKVAYADFAKKSWLITQEIKAQAKKDIDFLPETIV